MYATFSTVWLCPDLNLPVVMHFFIKRADRKECGILERKGFTLWFTGLPSSGKTTVSQLAVEKLQKRGFRVEILDEKEIRKNLITEPGVTKEYHDVVNTLIGFICTILSRNGVIVVAAAVSPCDETRQRNRREIEEYIEVLCTCPSEVLIAREAMYGDEKAPSSEKPNDDTIICNYEEPSNPDLILHTDRETPEESAGRVLRRLEELAYIPYTYEEPEPSLRQREQEIILRQLEDLGYI